jgi:hypothetical protein
MQRDPTQTYSHRGQLYGPGKPAGFSVADLDQIAPAKDEVQEGATPRLDLTRGASSDAFREKIGAPPDYAGMSVADLKALAQTRGITVEGRKKAEYVAALEAADRT